MANERPGDKERIVNNYFYPFVILCKCEGSFGHTKMRTLSKKAEYQKFI